MTDYSKNCDAKEGISYWKPSSAITPVVVFFLVVILGGLFAIIGQTGTRAKQGLPPAETVQAYSEEPGSAEFRKRETALNEREAALEKREKALAGKEQALNQYAGIRSRIIKELTDKLAALNLPIEINQSTGSVRFTEAVLFGVNSDSLNDSGQNNLKTFMPVYLSVLLSEENEKYLDQIIIEGHTDNNGGYWSNLFLSQNRANSVVNFILSKNLAELPNGDSAIKYLTVSSRSFNLPVIVNNVYDSSQSRRVEFVFRLKNEALVEQMQALGEGDQ